MVEYKRASEEFDPSSCSMEDISITARSNGEKFFTSADENFNGVGIRFVNTGVYRSVTRGIGGVDIAYSMLLIGLHLLTLITGFPRNSTQAQATKPFSASQNPNSHLNELEKHRQRNYPRGGTVDVIIWVGIFAVCLLQILVAATLYSGTRKRDGRVCIRNCRIWCFTSIFLNVVIVFQLLGIFIMGSAEDHVVAVCVYFAELILRTMAIIFIQAFVKDLQAELCDVENGDHVLYYQLCPTPSPKPGETREAAGSNNNTVSV